MITARRNAVKSGDLFARPQPPSAGLTLYSPPQRGQIVEPYCSHRTFARGRSLLFTVRRSALKSGSRIARPQPPPAAYSLQPVVTRSNRATALLARNLRPRLTLYSPPQCGQIGEPYCSHRTFARELGLLFTARRNAVKSWSRMSRIKDCSIFAAVFFIAAVKPQQSCKHCSDPLSLYRSRRGYCTSVFI